MTRIGRAAVLFGWSLVAIALFAGAFTNYEPDWIFLCGGGIGAVSVILGLSGEWARDA